MLSVRELDLACLLHSAGTDRPPPPPRPPHAEGEGEREEGQPPAPPPPSGVRLCERHARLVEGGLEMGEGEGDGEWEEAAASARSSSCWKGKAAAEASKGLRGGAGWYCTTEPPALLMVTWGAEAAGARGEWRPPGPPGKAPPSRGDADLGPCCCGSGSVDMGSGMCSSRSLAKGNLPLPPDVERSSPIPPPPSTPHSCSILTKKAAARKGPLGGHGPKRGRPSS